MSDIGAVALLRIPDWQPAEELDVRELDDGVLVFLEAPFESDDETLLDALEDAIGDRLHDHADERGVFLLPDSLEPDDAETYDAVIAAVGDAGRFAPLGQGALGDPQALMQHVFGAMGIDDPSSLIAAMEAGDPEAIRMAQIKMTGALERAMQQAKPRPPFPEASGEGPGNGEPGDKKK